MTFAYLVRDWLIRGVWGEQDKLLNCCSSVVNSQRLFCSKKNWLEMFILKLSGIHPFFIPFLIMEEIEICRTMFETF